MNEEQKKSNGLFEYDYTNNIETTQEELKEKGNRMIDAIIFFQYKKSNPNLTADELEQVLTEKYGKEKALQIISDAEDMKRMAEIDKMNKDAYSVHMEYVEKKKEEERKNHIIDEIIRFKTENQDIPADLFREEFIKKFMSSTLGKSDSDKKAAAEQIYKRRKKFMFDDNSIIHAKFTIDQSHFDLFLNNFFDNEGNCVIHGVDLTKEEAYEKINKLKKENEQKKNKELEIKQKAFLESIRKEGQDFSDTFNDEQMSILNEVNSIDYSLPPYGMLFVNIKLNALDYSDEQIMELFSTGFLNMNIENDLGVKSIGVDNNKYGLDSIIFLKKIGSLFMSKEEIQNNLNKEEIKRNAIVEGILNYKRKVENIDSGTIENESKPGQLSGGRHI